MLSARAGLEVMTTSIEQEPATMSATHTPLHFDATAVRRERMRQAALQGAGAPATSVVTKPIAAPAVVQFDASQLRRDRKPTERERTGRKPNNSGCRTDAAARLTPAPVEQTFDASHWFAARIHSKHRTQFVVPQLSM